MKYLVLMICILLFANAAIAQKGKSAPPPGNKAVLETIVARISQSGIYESQYVGFASSYSEQYKNFDQLLDVATDQDLLLLIKNEIPAVRIYAFKALLAKTPKLAASIFKDLKSDKAEIFTLEGCIGGQATVGALVTRFMNNSGASE
jgi:hypothetical protein